MQSSIKHQQKSHFVTILAWCLFVFTGIGLICSISQVAALFYILPKEVIGLGARENIPIPPFFLEHFKTIIGLIGIYFFIGFCSSIGLLRRKEIARQTTMILFAVSIITLQAMLVWQWVWVEQLPTHAITNERWLTFLKITSAAWVVSLSFLAGWLIKRLDEKSIRSEFSNSLFSFHTTNWSILILPMHF